MERLRAFACLLLLAAPLAAQKGLPPPSTPDAPVARVEDLVVARVELEELVVARRAMSEEGRAALRHLAESKLLESYGREHALSPSDAEVEARLREIDEAVKQAGDPRGLAGQMEKVRLSREQFARFLRLGIVHERATRRALNLPESTQVSGDQQRLWIEEELARRDFQSFPPPWSGGVVAKGAGFSIAPAEFLAHLLDRLPRETLRDDSRQLLLAKAMRRRMPDLAPESLKKAVDEELARRRAEVARDPRYKGVPYEELLAAQGVQANSLAVDPGIVSTALARLWVERKWSPEDLERAYRDERALFDGRHGPAIDARMLFLRAAKFKNELNPRNFDEAMAALGDLKARIRGLEDFERFARERSEDASSREQGGRVGWVAPGAEKVPPELSAAVAEALAIPEGQPGWQGLKGPVRVSNGVLLLWLGVRRPAPPWPQMSLHVQAELRRRFVDSCLPKAGVETAFEP